MGRPARTEEEDVDLSIFLTPEAWISLLTLIFLEIVLGVDNLVFISITTNRLPPEKQHIGRKLGLAGRPRYAHPVPCASHPIWCI